MRYLYEMIVVLRRRSLINFIDLFGSIKKMSYLCSVFFMVLDLRLTESRGCRETVPIRF